MNTYDTKKVTIKMRRLHFNSIKKFNVFKFCLKMNNCLFCAVNMMRSCKLTEATLVDTWFNQNWEKKKILYKKISKFKIISTTVFPFLTIPFFFESKIYYLNISCKLIFRNQEQPNLDLKLKTDLYNKNKIWYIIPIDYI